MATPQVLQEERGTEETDRKGNWDGYYGGFTWFPPFDAKLMINISNFFWNSVFKFISAYILLTKMELLKTSLNTHPDKYFWFLSSLLPNLTF